MIEIDTPEEEYETVKQMLSEVRKKGKDTVIEDIQMMSIKADIQLLKTTHDPKLMNRIETKLSEIKNKTYI